MTGEAKWLENKGFGEYVERFTMECAFLQLG